MAKELGIETRRGLERELGRLMRDAYGASSELRDKVRVWRDQYEGILRPKPQSWSSNINIPETKSAVSGAAVNIARAAVGVDPIFELEAEDPEWDDAAAAEEQYLQMWLDRMRYRTKVQLACREALITGQCWLRPGARRVRPTETRSVMPAGPMMLHELDVIPWCDYVVTEDMLLLPYTAASFELAAGAFARTLMRWNDIQMQGKGLYADAVERLEAEWQREHPTSQVHEQQGVTEVGPSSIWSASFECWEGIYRWCAPGERSEREYLILAYYPLDEGADPIILKCVEYEPLFGDAWFFFPLIADPRPNSLWGWSMCEDLRGIQAWLNAAFNQATDAVTMAILPPMAVPPGSQAARKQLRWGPMEIWTLNNPAEAQMLSTPASAIGGIQAQMAMVEFMRGQGERVSGMSDVMRGRPNEEKRTAYEISAVISAGNEKFEALVTTLQMGMDDNQGLEASAAMILRIIERFLPAVPVRYRKGKGQGWNIVDPRWHSGRYRFVARGSSATSNPAVRYKRAAQVRQEAIQSPFTKPSPADEPDEVLEKVRRWWALEARYYQAMGEKHVEEIIGAQPSTPQEALKVLYAVDPQTAMGLATRFGYLPAGAGPLVSAESGGAPGGPPVSAGLPGGAGGTGAAAGDLGVPGPPAEAGMAPV